MAYVIGVDVGRHVHRRRTGRRRRDRAGREVPVHPAGYSRGVLDVLTLLAEQLGVSLPEMLADTHHIAHGTTSSLNALVTGNVPPVGFLTTKGHRDSIFIMNVEGRYLGRSPDELQDVLGQAKDHGLLPKRHALEVTERIDRDGAVIVALDEDQARQAIRSLLDDGVRRSRSRCCGPSATRGTSGGSVSSIAEHRPDMFVALSRRSAPGSASSPATPPRS